MFGRNKLAELAPAHLIRLSIPRGDEADDLVGRARSLQRREYALVVRDALLLHPDLRLHDALRVLDLAFFQAVQERFGFLDLRFHGRDRVCLWRRNGLCNISVPYLPSDSRRILQFGEIIRLLDTQSLKGHICIRDLLSGAAVLKNGRLVKERQLCLGSWRNAFDRGCLWDGVTFCICKRRKEFQRPFFFFCRSFLRLCGKCLFRLGLGVCRLRLNLFRIKLGLDFFCQSWRGRRRCGFIRTAAEDLIYVKLLIVVQ